MSDEADNPRWQLLVGDARQVTAAALVAALVLFCIGSAVEYMTLVNVMRLSETNPYGHLLPAFVVMPLTDLHGWAWVPGYLLASTLSAGHAYFNRGYLPSLVLALSPSVGGELWIIYGIDEYVALAPAAEVYGTVVVEGLVVATIGFLVGLCLRHVRRPERLVMRSTDPVDS